jgi:hypothetical protein
LRFEATSPSLLQVLVPVLGIPRFPGSPIQKGIGPQTTAAL